MKRKQDIWLDKLFPKKHRPMHRRFGIFASLFDSEPVYLSFLSLDPRTGKAAVSRVIESCRLSSKPFSDAGRLFGDEGWRSHLVGAVALCVLGYDHAAFTRLWSAFDSGSWVTPQLAVVAYIRDPDFSNQARVRVQARCPVDASSIAPTGALERHIVHGTGGASERSAKAASALVFLLKLTGPPDWLMTELASPDLLALLAADRDRGSEITEAWLISMKAMLRSMAIKTDIL